MPSSGPHAIMETPAPLVYGIVNNALLHSMLQPNHQSDAASNCPHRAFFSGRLVTALYLDFVVNWIEVGVVGLPQI